jgi:hypothetical protein
MSFTIFGWTIDQWWAVGVSTEDFVRAANEDKEALRDMLERSQKWRSSHGFDPLKSPLVIPERPFSLRPKHDEVRAEIIRQAQDDGRTFGLT